MTQPPPPEQPWNGQPDSGPQPGSPADQPPTAPAGQPWSGPAGQPWGAPGGRPYPGAQPPGVPAGAPLTPQDERTWAILSHVGMILFSFVAPLIIWLVFRGRGPYLEDQAKEALNFSLTVLIAYLGAGVLTAITFGLLSPLFALIGIGSLVLGILAAVAANQYAWYRYPVCIRFVK